MAVVTLAHQAAIANLYIALFNRAPDADGFAFWTQALANGASLDALAQGFVQTPEAQVIYPAGQTTAQFITAYYTNVLGRAPDASGLVFWGELLDAAGGVNSNAARALVVSKIVEVVNTPLPVKPEDLTDTAYTLTYADRNAFKNKGEVAIFYATEYKGNDLALAKQVLAVVGPTTGTIDIAKGLLSGNTGGGGTPAPAPAPPPAPVVPGIEFVGTVSADNFVGQSGDDTFTFVIDTVTPANSTVNSNDKISGAAGNDTLTVTTTGVIADANFSFNGINSIETVLLKRTDGSSLAFEARLGMNTVSVEGGAGAVTISELAQDAKLVLKGLSGGQVTANYRAAATNAALELTGNVNGSSVQFQGNGAVSMAIASTGSPNVLNEMITAANVMTVNIVADTALTMNKLQASSVGATVNISGAGAVDLGVIQSLSLKTINAGENRGGLTAKLHADNSVTTITGSKGNDVIYTFDAVLTTGSVNAGDGTGAGDRLVVGSTASLATPELGAKYTGFEILQVENGVSVDLANIGGITSVVINDGNGATGVSNLSAAQAEKVTILSANATGAISIGVAGASTGGQVDTVKATVATADGQSINLRGLTLTGVEKLELVGNGEAFANNGLLTLNTANATSLDSIIVTNEAGVSITIDAAHAATSLSIDASGAKGPTTIDASAYTIAGVTIKGGAGGGTLTGSAKGDTIVGGAGNDTIIAGATVLAPAVFDTLTGGEGADTFVFAVAANDTEHVGITAVITDFTTGQDKIQLTLSGPYDASYYQEAPAAVADLPTLLTAAIAAMSPTMRVYVGQVGDNSYVVADVNGTGYTEVIELTGVALTGIAFGDFVPMSGQPPID